MELRALAQERDQAINTPQKDRSESSEKVDKYNRHRHRNLTNVDKRKKSLVKSPRDFSVEIAATRTTTTKT